MRVCLKSVKKIIPNVVEVISSSGYIFPGVVKKGRVFFLASIVNTSLFFFLSWEIISIYLIQQPASCFPRKR